MLKSHNFFLPSCKSVLKGSVLACAMAVPFGSVAQAETEMAMLEAPEGGFGLGREALSEEISAWDIDVRPDGQGLPEGSGDVFTGEGIYLENCASCHGDFGEAVGRWPVLAGGDDTLASDRPVKTVGSYWPYASTVFDYIHRAMPFGAAQSLTDDEVYALTAYVLYLNYLVEDDFVLSRETFNELELPNQDSFFPDDREEVEFPEFTQAPCMENCKDTVEITARARVLDVTPETSEDASTEEAAEATTETAAEEESIEVAAAEAMPEPDPELVAAGERVFRKCKACHQVGEGAANRTGPHLNGIMGRVAGAMEGFRYSSAMEEAGANGLSWTAESLAEFLANPRQNMRGTKMAFAGLRKEEDIAAITAYLSTLTE